MPSYPGRTGVVGRTGSDHNEIRHLRKIPLSVLQVSSDSGVTAAQMALASNDVEECFVVLPPTAVVY